MWWIPTAVSAASSILGASSASKSAKAQAQAAAYNAQVSFSTDITNIQLSSNINQVNIDTAFAASDFQDSLAESSATFAADTIRLTALHDDLLYEEDIKSVWAQNNLDTELLEQQRLRERGQIVAQQAASGTVIGQGSNADAVVDQMTQEAMDKFILRTGAHVKAAQITNQRVQSLWKAEQEVSRLAYQTNMDRIANKTTTLLKTGAMSTQSYLESIVGLENANAKFYTQSSSIASASGSASSKISSDLFGGLFGAAAQGYSGYEEQQYKQAAIDKLTK